MSNALLEKLAALRAKSVPENTSILSSDSVQHKLSTYLILYSKADTACYVNYMKGAKALLYFLTYGKQNSLDLELDKYPQIADSSFKVPALGSGYAANELATLLSGQTYGAEHMMYARAIYITTHDLVMRGLI